MTSTATTWQPVTVLRRAIETHILDLYDTNGSLKPQSQWPGVYHLSDGSSIPAVYVVGPSMVPSDWNIEGIEATIQAVPEYSSPGSLNGVLSMETWTVRFTNYGTREGTEMPTTMLEIVRRLARAFPRDRVSYLPRTDATYEAATARIRGAVLNPPIP